MRIFTICFKKQEYLKVYNDFVFYLFYRRLGQKPPATSASLTTFSSDRPSPIGPAPDSFFLSTLRRSCSPVVIPTDGRKVNISIFFSITVKIGFVCVPRNYYLEFSSRRVKKM